jgi:hypothetical protein
MPLTIAGKGKGKGKLTLRVQAPAVPFVVDDDSDSWWSASGNGFVSVPLAGAVAGLSLAVSIAGGFTHQDEVPFKRVVSGHESVQIIPIGDEPIVAPFIANDEIVPQPAVTIVDETEGPPLFTRLETTFTQVWNAQDELPTRIDEDYWWLSSQAPVVVSLTLGPRPVSDEEIVPQAVVFTPDEDYYWQAPVVVSFSVSALPQVEPDAIPVTLIAEEHAWPIPVLPVASIQQAFASDEEIVPQAATVTPDEVYWWQPGSSGVEIVVVNWPVLGGGGVPQTAVPLPFDEEPWQVYTPPLIAPLGLYLPDPEVLVVTAPTPLPFDEEVWQVYTPPLPKAQPLYLPDPEQTPALFAPAGSDVAAGSYGGRRVYTTEFKLWEFVEDFPQPVVTPLPFDEEPWQVYTPPLVEPKPLYLPDPEEIPAGSLFVASEQDYWQPFSPQPDPLIVTVWAENDQIVPQPVPLPIDEEPWQVWTPLWLAAQPLYLPDPEEIPAGSLIPTPVVDIPPGTSGGRYYRYLPALDDCEREIKELEKRRDRVERRIAKLEKNEDSKQEQLAAEESMRRVKDLIAQLTRIEEELQALKLKLAEIEEEEMMLMTVICDVYERFT